MAQYGYAMQQATSSSQTLQALADWNTYVSSRTQWGLSSTLVSRLAAADWKARGAGSPTITPEQLAAAATRLINARLATMTAEQQQQGFKRMMREVTPKGNLALNPLVSYMSATRQSDGRWTVTISPPGFSRRKSVFAQFAPGMVSRSENFYPGEAMLVSYSLASEDMGYGLDFQAMIKKRIGDLTGLDMGSRSLYGENGYFVRRPLNTFLTEEAISQYFFELGF